MNYRCARTVLIIFLINLLVVAHDIHLPFIVHFANKYVLTLFFRIFRIFIFGPGAQFWLVLKLDLQETRKKDAAAGVQILILLS